MSDKLCPSCGENSDVEMNAGGQYICRRCAVHRAHHYPELIKACSLVLRDLYDKGILLEDDTEKALISAVNRATVSDHEDGNEDIVEAGHKLYRMYCRMRRDRDGDYSLPSSQERRKDCEGRFIGLAKMLSERDIDPSDFMSWIGDTCESPFPSTVTSEVAVKAYEERER